MEDVRIDQQAVMEFDAEETRVKKRPDVVERNKVGMQTSSG